MADGGKAALRAVDCRDAKAQTNEAASNAALDSGIVVGSFFFFGEDFHDRGPESSSQRTGQSSMCALDRRSESDVMSVTGSTSRAAAAGRPQLGVDRDTAEPGLGAPEGTP